MSHCGDVARGVVAVLLSEQFRGVELGGGGGGGGSESPPLQIG